ncbi:MAG: hypothetical protein NTY38_05605, partial [Acidobacteria bacterium]|nr:hypothetical protein [Acidobacteriota bacterium]
MHEELLAAQQRHPGEPVTIRAHSNGAITIWRLRERLAEDVKKGRLNLKEIDIAGAGVAASLQDYFVKQGVRVRVNEENPANRLSDVVRMITTPNAELARDLGQPRSWLDSVSGALVKGGGLLVMAGQRKGAPETIGVAHHSIEDNYPNLLPRPRSTAGLDLSKDPLLSARKELGGINLTAAGEFSADLGSVSGAVFDPAKQWLVLLTEPADPATSATPADFAVALALARAGKEASFSLDPADRNNPHGPWMKAVYRPLEILGPTRFGRTLFEADWLLKQYSFKVAEGPDGRWVERQTKVAGLKSIPELMFESETKREGERWSRAWIEVDKEKVGVRLENGVALVDKPRMVIHNRTMVPDPSTEMGLRDVEEVSDPINNRFSEVFTGLYDQISEESPQFGRVRELVKTVVLAKWMVQNNVPVDEEWLQSVLKPGEAIVRVHSITATPERVTRRPYSKDGREGMETIRRTVHLFGGVNGRVALEPRSGGQPTLSVRDAVYKQTRGSSRES